MIIVAVAAVVIVPPMFVAFALCRAAAYGDQDLDDRTGDVCPGCDGFLEFDTDGSNLCTTCGSTWQHPTLNRRDRR